MPMIYCPECESAASPKAPLCPQCGHPLQASNDQTNSKQDGIFVTTQRTGKALKVRMMLASLVMVFGALMIMLGFALDLDGGNIGGYIRIVGLIMAIVGAAAMVAVKVSIWWHHE